MKVLFIGGTGRISSACSQLAVEKGFDLYLLNRGQTSLRSAPIEAHLFIVDIRDRNSVVKAIDNLKFDVVVDWIAYTPGHIETDLELFRGKTDQYIFISSASSYQSPPEKLPITESTPLENPYWEYSQKKIACEERLMKAYSDENFPVTIVRPSHTYDKTSFPVIGRYTVVDRMQKGKKILVHGDGTSLWVLTHNTDFAKGFTGLLGNSQAIGETFQITSDELLSWNQIYDITAKAAGTKAIIVHVPTDFIATFSKELGAELLGDKSMSVIFDNTKIKKLVPDFAATIPYSQGVKEIVAWHDADPKRQIVDEEFNKLSDKIISAYESAYP